MKEDEYLSDSFTGELAGYNQRLLDGPDVADSIEALYVTYTQTHKDADKNA